MTKVSLGEFGGVLFIIVFLVIALLIGCWVLYSILPGDVTRRD